MKRHSVTVSFEELDIVLGEWCDSCLLPSAVSAHYALFIGGELNRVTTYSLCMDCDRGRWSS